MRPLIERLLGKSIVWAEGEEHRRMSRALNGCFTAEKVRGMQGAVVESANKVSSVCFCLLPISLSLSIWY